MGRYFIVSEAFCHKTLCFCQTDEHKMEFQFNQGDIIEFVGDCYVSVSHGLFYMVVINHAHTFYMSMEEIDQNFLSKRFVSINDINYMIEQLRNYVDYSLDMGDKKLFLHYSEQLIDSMKLVRNYENHITAI
jgi:uncharacterized protein YpiB (UPF0302 family)